MAADCGGAAVPGACGNLETDGISGKYDGKYYSNDSCIFLYGERAEK